jgi:hypothetical protein
VTPQAARGYWAVCAAGGLLVVIAWLLPGVSLYLNGYIGAGASQQGFDFQRTISLASQHSWTSIALPAAGLAILLVAALGFASPRERPLFVVVAGIAAAALIHFERATNFTPGHEREGGVYACDRATAEDPGACAGSILRLALRDFSADIRSGPVGRREGFVLQDGYRAARRAASNKLEWGLIAVLLVAGYASIRFVVRRWWVALLLLVAATLAVLIWLFLQALSGLE